MTSSRLLPCNPIAGWSGWHEATPPQVTKVLALRGVELLAARSEGRSEVERQSPVLATVGEMLRPLGWVLALALAMPRNASADEAPPALFGIWQTGVDNVWAYGRPSLLLRKTAKGWVRVEVP